MNLLSAEEPAKNLQSIIAAVTGIYFGPYTIEAYFMPKIMAH